MFKIAAVSKEKNSAGRNWNDFPMLGKNAKKVKSSEFARHRHARKQKADWNQ